MRFNIKSLSAACAIALLPQLSLAENEQTIPPWEQKLTVLRDNLVGGSASVKSSGLLRTNKAFSTFPSQLTNKDRLVDFEFGTNATLGCNGVNLGTVMDGQLERYEKQIDTFIDEAPTMAIMYIAMSQPVVKSIIDELNQHLNFGLDGSLATCRDLQAKLNSNPYDDPAKHAEDDCTSAEGQASEDCNGSNLAESVREVLGEQRNKLQSTLDDLQNKINTTTGGSGGSTGSSGSGSSAGNSSGTSSPSPVINAEPSFTNLVLATSNINFQTIKDYQGLLPDYLAGEDGIEVKPKEKSIYSIHSDLSDQYYDKLVALSKAYLETADFSNFNDNELYIDFSTKSGYLLSTAELDALGKALQSSDIGYLQFVSTNFALRDINSTIFKLSSAIETGISGQAGKELIPEQVKDGLITAVNALITEKEAVESQIQYDHKVYEALMVNRK